MRTFWLLPFAVLTTTSNGSVAMEERFNPIADPHAMVISGQARFTILTPSLIRLEWSPPCTFEDRASLVFLNRRLEVPAYTAEHTDGQITIQTDELIVRYKTDERPFSVENLSIESGGQGHSEKGPVPFFRWTPGLEDRGNLKGTFRTLDTISGGVPLPAGLLSRDGWVLVDDSQRLLFDRVPGTDWPWVVPRAEKDAQDWYFFGYGHDYKRALRDFTRLAGRVPLPPRFAFGAWWSRYWAYTAQELRELVHDFREHHVPLDVLVIDMDWHLEGWTGYTWNPDDFPDPEGFLKWVHDQGLRVTLNLHPADGVRKHERAFPEVARAMGLNPETTDQVPFDCTNPRYIDAYFKYLHHPLERQGVDFWWIDWQQGEKTQIEGLDPLWWLNHLHWTDLERNPERGGRRPMMFSRWGGLGNHRYQIGFSGDTYCNWPSLAFQPYFTATAGNVCYPYWSHDIGGHQPGPVEPELYARWIQWGVFSPILRTHTTKNADAERRMWKFPPKVFEAAREAFHLRYALLPYIYTAARQCYDTAMPLCRPLYYEWPELEEAYRHTGEYLFGDDLLLAPVTKPVNPLSGCAEISVWLPPGEWVYWFSGRSYTGPADVALQVALDEIPIFVRAGAIIPTQPDMHRTGERPVNPLILHIWPGESGSTRVYEDDGESVGYQKNECAWTPVSHKIVEGVRQITIGPTEGEFKGMPQVRRYEIHLRDAAPTDEVSVNGMRLQWAQAYEETGLQYDQGTMSEVIGVPGQSVRQAIVVRVTSDPVFGKSEAALRSGFRGQWHRMLEVAALLSYEGPDLGTDESAASHLLDKIADPGLEPALARRALMRLLALQCQIEATAADGDKVKVSGVVTFSPPEGLLPSASGRLELAPPPNWSIQGPRTWDWDNLAPDRPTRVEAVLLPEGLPQTTVLESKFTLQSVNNLRHEIPQRQVLLPSINRWWVVGPFPADFKTGLDQGFPPEQTIDLHATYEGTKGERIGWKRVERALTPGEDLAAEFFVKLPEVFGRYEANAVCYALTYLRAPEDTEAVLAFGTDDGVAIWLNGVEIHRRQVGRPYVSKQDRVPVRLKKGPNALLLKVSQWGGDWGFCVHLETPDGGALTSVTVHLEP